MEGAEPRSSWQTTALWTELSDRGEQPAEGLTLALTHALDKTEKVLRSGGEPPNFALHDAEHSRRVAERMAAIAGPDLLREMGPHDLGMLLLSAYLHDIGMSPPLSKVDRLHAYLLSGEGESLSEDEREQLQAWLDDEWDGRVPPLPEGATTAADLRLAQRILAGYVRHRHNDWSEGWIRENLAELEDPKGLGEHVYPGWLDDLILLCRSHHFAIDQLRGAEFDPHLVGSPATVLHLRYCACLLRVADVLDFDPERTPAILFAHRAVEGKSVIFWHKDHDLAFEQEGSKLLLHAQPRDALTHHAIKRTIEDVDRELLGCRRLADETEIDHMLEGGKTLPHEWHLETSVRDRVLPRDDAYEYVDGTFRPDTSKLLELVGGIELYGDAFAAVRELLQNAFDAVRDQIARQRLKQDDPASEETADHIARTHSISLTLERDDAGLRLVCRDTGSGMSRDIIISRFLVGGKRANHEMRALERTCREHGFSTGKTARFGIGVLSYFLIGSEMSIRTRRSLEANDPDNVGWDFSTTGLDDFGELKRAPQAQVGTEVALRVHPHLIEGDPEKFAAGLLAYVEETVRRVPCRFAFSAPGLAQASFTSELGWVDRRDAVEMSFVHEGTKYSLDSAALELLPSSERVQRESRSEYWQATRRKALEALSLEVHEGELREGLGRYRACFGYFELGERASAAYLSLRCPQGKAIEVERTGANDGLRPTGSLVTSWNGMAVDMESKRPVLSRGLRRTHNFFVEIDWCDDAAGRLSVSRNSFEPSRAAKRALAAVERRLDEIRSDFAQRCAGSELYLLNCRALGTAADPAAPLSWPTADGLGAERRIRPFAQLSPPLILRSDEAAAASYEGLGWRGREVTAVRPLSLALDRRRSVNLSWHGADFGPSAVAAARRHGRLQIIPVWEEIGPVRRLGGSRTGFVTEFPPQWRNLAGVEAEGPGGHRAMTVWNSSHPLVRACDAESWEWAATAFQGNSDPLGDRAGLESSAGRIAAWTLQNGRRYANQIWEGLIERDESFVTRLWAEVPGLDEYDEVAVWQQRLLGADLTILTRSGRRQVDGAKEPDEAGRRIESPGEEWWLLYEDGTPGIERPRL